MALGRRSNHCCKTIEGRSSCSKINSSMEHVRHLLSRGNFMLMITTNCKHSSVTSRNLPKCEREVAFRTFSAGWSFTGLYSPPCFGSCLILPLQADFSLVGASQTPNFRLYIPAQVDFLILKLLLHLINHGLG